MGSVTLAEAWPRPGEPFTVDDLDRMPDDGHHYELLDGTLIVSPAPGAPHQRASAMGAYTEVAQVTGDEVFRASRPFPVDIAPSHLIAKLRPS